MQCPHINRTHVFYRTQNAKTTEYYNRGIKTTQQNPIPFIIKILNEL